MIRAVCVGLAWGAVVCLVEAQAVYRVTVKGQPSGEARMTQRLLPDGGKFVELVVTLRKGGDRMVVKSQTTFTNLGEPVHAVQNLYPFGKPPIRELIADFDAAGASVVIRAHSSPQVVKSPVRPGDTYANASEFWFIRDKPKPGEECKVYTYNMDKLMWELSVFRYVGETKEGSQVELKRGARTVTTVFDTSGYPVTVDDSAGVRFERER